MTELRGLWWIALAAGLGVLLYWLAPVLTPFLFAALLAHIAHPAVSRLAVWRIPRTLSVILIFLVLILVFTVLVLVLVPQIHLQISRFAAKLPGYLDWLQQTLQQTLAPWLERNLGVPLVLDGETLKGTIQQHWKELGGALGAVMGALTRSGLGLLGWLFNLVLIPVVTFYLLRDWDRILERTEGLLPPRWRRPVARLAGEIDAVLGSFLRGQLTVMTLLACFYSLGLWWIGLDLALPIGILAGLVSFVPYLGFVTGLLCAAAAALLQFQEAGALIGVVAVFGLGQALEGMVLTPYLVGERIGLHPVAVIFAVLAGGQLFGFFGVLLALPAAAAIAVWLRHLQRRYRKSAFYRRARRP